MIFPFSFLFEADFIDIGFLFNLLLYDELIFFISFLFWGTNKLIIWTFLGGWLPFINFFSSVLDILLILFVLFLKALYPEFGFCFFLVILIFLFIDWFFGATRFILISFFCKLILGRKLLFFDFFLLVVFSFLWLLCIILYDFGLWTFFCLGNLLLILLFEKIFFSLFCSDNALSFFFFVGIILFTGFMLCIFLMLFILFSFLVIFAEMLLWIFSADFPLCFLAKFLASIII